MAKIFVLMQFKMPVNPQGAVSLFKEGRNRIEDKDRPGRFKFVNNLKRIQLMRSFWLSRNKRNS